MLVPPAAQVVDQGFGYVLDHRKTTRHVAVQRGVTHGHLTLVASGEHDPAKLVGDGHYHIAPDARLHVFLGHAGLHALEPFLQHIGKGYVGRLNGNDPEVDAQVVGQFFGVADAALGGIPGGHAHAHHVLPSQGIHRYHGGQRRVDASRQPDNRFAEARLVDVVAGTQHQRPVDLLHVANAIPQVGRR